MKTINISGDCIEKVFPDQGFRWMKIFVRSPETGYFSLTCETRNMGGCAHREILMVRPDLKPFADLHLSDRDGVPMYAEENGLYFLAGELKCSALFQYRYGNSGFRHENPREVAAKHFRVSREEIDALIASLVLLGADVLRIRDAIRQFVDVQRNRWKDEADNAKRLFDSL